MSWSPELLIGELRPWPDTVHVVRAKTEETRRYVPERTAHKVTHGGQIVGHMTCSACGETVNRRDRYCWACGCRMEGE